MSLPPVSALLSRANLATASKQKERIGAVRALEGLLVRAEGVHAQVGTLCRIDSANVSAYESRLAEVVGFSGGELLLLPIAGLGGIGAGDEVRALGSKLQVPVGDACLGRVLDGLGRPLDGAGPIGRDGQCPVRTVDAEAPPALSRPVIRQGLDTGIAAIDGFLTLGLGQRVGIFAGSGVGKSTLLGGIAKSSNADVNVIALVGERGREVQEFLEDVLGTEGLQRSVLIVATSDAPALVRAKATMTALTIAESFRDAGKHVLLTMDSVTRFANAQREIGLAIGEPPTLRGYPPSFFATLPRIVERLGATESGSITGLLTVLVEGDDLNEPVADTLRGLLDGHIVLDRGLAQRGSYPAISVLDSVSRLMPRLVDDGDIDAARRLRACMAILEESRELVQVGAYQHGSDPRLDAALAIRADLERLVHHGNEVTPAAETRRRMLELAQRVGGAA